MSRVLQQCDCGCGGEAYHSQMVTIEVEQAIDKSLRTAGTTRRFWVLRQCKKPYEEELACSLLLQRLVTVWTPRQKTLLQKLNFLLTFYNWLTRIVVARQVLRLQHAIFERNYGFEYARTRATNSAILFAAPRFMQGFLARRFTRRLAKATAAAAMRRKRNGEET